MVTPVETKVCPRCQGKGKLFADIKNDSDCFLCEGKGTIEVKRHRDD